ncbi:ankyrin repeat domain-containing protein [Candidatus Mesenet endosymbiont of Agriotes lineatus]|uniref:ankyrin repeat domain-containing protein n=1 Tax=Candidatus Mesenet endosymbiont of Agriotes lineatus TaxID=3077948 RepID=UPI0030CE2CF5
MSLDNELIKAVNSKNIKEVKSLLDKGEDPNVECDTWTPIHHAASSLREDIVELLIRYGANINGICNSSRIPLHTAICYPCTFGWSGNRDMARLLLKYGADVDAKDNYGLTPLLELLENEKYYRHRGESQNIRVEIIKLLLEKGANVDVKSKNGLTPLHYAANYDCTEIVELLLKSGADVNAKSNDGLTPLHYAAKYDCTEIVELLLKSGADVDVKSKNGLTPLLGLLENVKYYSYMGDSQNIRVEIIKLLLEKGANVDVKSENGLTPLHYAAKYGYTEIVELFLKSGADVNAKDNYGLTPLLRLLENVKYYSYIGDSQNIRVEIIKLLLEKGADVNAKSNGGLTPLGLSKQYLSKHKKDAFKTGALTGIIEEVILDKHKKDIKLQYSLEEKDHGISDKDILNLRLVCKRANNNARACYKRYKVKPELLLTQLEEIEPSNKRQR